ncbi:Zinc-type alcohol dehydrogenase-like protein [Lachnellula suecica]|uniref:Zinc-type alcohol dehydrogenase-like protein n=1 Tax=Lachnellula suecica TaxID=602035 RepID=A0A8T9CEP0_9HELO|nr:Zinc-type alcohol dehydrogenase-like protein [Lachnellula suecica]
MSSQTVFRLTSKGIEGLQASKEPIPTIDKYEVLVKVRSVALNQRDVAIATSTYPLPVKDNLIPCSDMAGEVVQVGDAVHNFAVGDAVIAANNPEYQFGVMKDTSSAFGGLQDGLLREYVSVPAYGLIKLPKSSHDFTQWAALVQAGTTAWNALYGNAPLKAGDTVLLMGTGGISLVALIFAKAAGATTIITSSSDEKLARARSEFGADYTINYTTHPNWAAEVQRITNGQGANHILDIGGSGTIAQSLESVALGGVISVIGFLSFASQEDMPNVAMMSIVRGCVIRGIQSGSKQQLEEAVRFMGTRELKMPVDKTFAFDREGIIAGLNFVASGKHIGKVCINLD